MCSIDPPPVVDVYKISMERLGCPDGSCSKYSLSIFKSIDSENVTW